MKIHLSGYSEAEKEELIQAIRHFGFEFDEKYSLQTSVLVCETVLLIKYKVAKMKQIKIVTKLWLLDSFRQKEVLNMDKYEVKIFQNLDFFLLGIEESKRNLLCSLIRENNGKIHTEIKPDIRYFILTSPNVELHSLSAPKSLFIDVEWLIQCAQENQFLMPEKFVLKGEQKKFEQVNFHCTLEEIDHQLREQEPSSSTLKVLENQFFYFHQTGQFSGEYLRLLQRVINLLGGFYSPIFLSKTTHVVVERINESEIGNYQSQHTIHLVHPLYLLHSLLYKQKVNELEYPPKILKRDDSVHRIMQRTQSTTPQFKSFLFENIFFFIAPNVSNLQSLQIKLIENSGSILTNP